jgi:hypothetical protein
MYDALPCREFYDLLLQLARLLNEIGANDVERSCCCKDPTAGLAAASAFQVSLERSDRTLPKGESAGVR